MQQSLQFLQAPAMELQSLIQQEIDRANAKYAQVEQVKKFAILDHDLSQATGELTPTLKVKRNVVNEKYASILDALYDEYRDPNYAAVPLLRRMVTAELLGRKSGRGFLDYRK